MKQSRTKLKSLQTHKSAVIAKIKEKEALLNEVNEDICTLRKKVQKADRTLTRFKQNSSELIVSEHAVLRYIERVMMIDIESLIEKIVSKKERQQCKTLGNSGLSKDGYKLVIQNGVVVTVKAI